MKKLDPKAIVVLALGPFIVFSILTFIVLIMVYRVNLELALTIGMVLGLIFSAFRYTLYGYELDDNGFTFKHGFSKSIDTIAYGDIKGVKIRRGLFLNRVLGLSLVTVLVDQKYYEEHPNSRSFVIGAADAGAELPGLRKNIAEQLRIDLLNRAHSNVQGTANI